MSKSLFAAVLAAGLMVADVVAQEPEARSDAPSSRPAGDAKMTVTASGLQYEVVVAGPEGAKPKRGDHVSVRYTGTLMDGTEFDSSKKGEPVSFRLGQVIEGWNEGLKLMTSGSKYRFVIHPDLAYGPRGTPDGRIPPGATLRFDIELVSFREGAALPEPPQCAEFDPEKSETTKTGVKWQVLAEGTGEPAGPDDTIAVHFCLWGPDKKLIFASASSGGECQQIPARSLVNQSGIPFFREMLPKMKAGERRLIEAPALQAFGAAGNPAQGIPAGATTTWELYVEKISKPAPPPKPMPVPEFVQPSNMTLAETPSGLKHSTTREGTGASPKRSDRVEVHYAGWLEDGTPFDSSYLRGATTTFPLGNVIPGWTEGLQLMKEGGAAWFVIPSKLAYGPSGRPKIPGNATLVFYIELVKVN